GHAAPAPGRARGAARRGPPGPLPARAPRARRRPRSRPMTAAPTVRRAHRMPFGALPLADGGTMFRLWSPGADRVELWLEEPKRAVPMPRDAGGWAEDGGREGAP